MMTNMCKSDSYKINNNGTFNFCLVGSSSVPKIYGKKRMKYPLILKRIESIKKFLTIIFKDIFIKSYIFIKSCILIRK